MKLPPMSQLGIIVKDLEASAKKYSTLLGIHPWYQAKLTDQSITYKDKIIDLELDIAVGYSGKLQFELIQVVEGGPNIYSDLMDKQGEGLHHIGYVVSDIDKGTGFFKACGFSPLQYGHLETEGKAHTRFVYFDTFEAYGYYIELIQTTLFGINVGMSRHMMKLGKLFGDVALLNNRL